MRLECLCPVLNESLTRTFPRPNTPFSSFDAELDGGDNSATRNTRG